MTAPTPEDFERARLRFEKHVYMDPMSGCWIWTGAWTPKRYGVMSGDDPHCVSRGHLRTDHPRDGRCGAALSERCWCQGFAGAAHDVQWNGCFRGTNEDPRECGWCETCGQEVYDNDGHGHRRTNNE